MFKSSLNKLHVIFHRLCSYFYGIYLTSDLLSSQGKRSRADRGSSSGVSVLRSSPHPTHRHPEEESPPFRGTLRTGNELQGVQSLITELWSQQVHA